MGQMFQCFLFFLEKSPETGYGLFLLTEKIIRFRSLDIYVPGECRVQEKVFPYKSRMIYFIQNSEHPRDFKLL